eukprot:15443507-Alexandrium_andersonii.AAC.1
MMTTMLVVMRMIMWMMMAAMVRQRRNIGREFVQRKGAQQVTARLPEQVSPGPALGGSASNHWE